MFFQMDVGGRFERFRPPRKSRIRVRFALRHSQRNAIKLSTTVYMDWVPRFIKSTRDKKRILSSQIDTSRRTESIILRRSADKSTA